LRIIDITNPTTPIEVGCYDSISNLSCVYALNYYAYITNSSYGCRVIDISNPTKPVEVGYYVTDGDAFGIFVANNYLYLTDRGFNVLEYIAPSSIGNWYSSLVKSKNDNAKKYFI